MINEVDGLEERPKAEIHVLTQNNTKQISNKKVSPSYTDSGSRNSPPFTTDYH